MLSNVCGALSGVGTLTTMVVLATLGIGVAILWWYGVLPGFRRKLRRVVRERRRAENELGRSETMCRRILENLQGVFYQTDDSGMITDISHSVRRYTGFSREELVGKPLTAFCRYWEDGERLWTTLCARGEVTDLEIRMKADDGKPVCMSVCARSLHDDTGKLTGSEGCLVDITERKRMEEALERSERKIRDIASSLGEGVYLFNAEGSLTFMNNEATRLLGWTEEELRDKNVHDVIHNRKPDGTPLSFDECLIRDVLVTGKRFFSRDEVFVRKDGTVFPASVNTTPLVEEGRVVGALTAFRDISDAKRLEHEREALIGELKQALATIRTLHGILPICACCKKIRDDRGSWEQIEAYISAHTEAKFSHGLCWDCESKLYPEFFRRDA